MSRRARLSRPRSPVRLKSRKKATHRVTLVNLRATGTAAPQVQALRREGCEAARASAGLRAASPHLRRAVLTFMRPIGAARVYPMNSPALPAESGATCPMKISFLIFAGAALAASAAPAAAQPVAQPRAQD